MRRFAALAGALLAAVALPVCAEEGAPAAGEAGEAAPERFSLHFQSTIATQWHPSFRSPYSGPNSMPGGAESATSVVSDLFAGARLWPGGEAYFQPELAGGRGLGSTLGVAAFPSGEVYRVGDPTPGIIVGRAFVRQVVGIGGGEVRVEAGPNALGGPRDRDALVITAGKIATTDVFDANPVSNDPHTRFSSWGLWASAAYDYPADTHGYTFGVAADLSVGPWSARAGMFLEPLTANGMDLEWDVSRARGLALEGERRWSWGERAGAVRVLLFHNTAHMGSYDAALAAAPSAPDVTSTRARRVKYGFAASANQDLGGGRAAFLRVSANDGATESWAFTEIDRSMAGGVVQSGSAWGRPGDEAGLAAVISGLSGPHRRYLAAGGLGFLLGDGALAYAPEVLVELYGRLALTPEIAMLGSYQLVVDPGYNADRGPVHVLGARLHVGM